MNGPAIARHRWHIPAATVCGALAGLCSNVVPLTTWGMHLIVIIGIAFVALSWVPLAAAVAKVRRTAMPYWALAPALVLSSPLPTHSWPLAKAAALALYILLIGLCWRTLP